MTLSRSDVAAAASAVQVLASPLDFPTADAWRAAVNRKLRVLLNADSAGFMLPPADSGFLFSEEHDPVALSRYPELMPPLLSNGQTVFEAAIGHEVNVLERTYGADFDLYLNSEYYNEYAGANGAHDTLFAFMYSPEFGMAGLQFWHEHPTRRKFADRDVALLELLYPAMRAGVQTHLLLTAQRTSLMQLLDDIGQSMVVYDVTGRMVHETPQLASMLASDPDSATVRLRLNAFHMPATEYEFNTATAAYSIRTFLYDIPGEGSCTVACVERKTALLMGDRDLYATYGLSPAEIRVARAIAEGLQNAVIAERLYLSPHTVRRHTERVLHKLGVCARTEVRAKIIARG